MKTKYLIWGGIGLLVVWLWKSGKLSGLSTALTKVGAQVNPANANIPSAAAPNILAQGQDYLAAAGGVSSAAGSSLKNVWGNITGMFGGASTATVYASAHHFLGRSGCSAALRQPEQFRQHGFCREQRRSGRR